MFRKSQLGLVFYTIFSIVFSVALTLFVIPKLTCDQ